MESGYFGLQEQMGEAFGRWISSSQIEPPKALIEPLLVHLQKDILALICLRDGLADVRTYLVTPPAEPEALE